MLTQMKFDSFNENSYENRAEEKRKEEQKNMDSVIICAPINWLTD